MTTQAIERWESPPFSGFKPTKSRAFDERRKEPLKPRAHLSFFLLLAFKEIDCQDDNHLPRFKRGLAKPLSKYLLELLYRI